MVNFKLIAFNMRNIGGEPPPTLAGLAERSRSGETISVEALRKAGVPVAVPLLNRKAESGELKGLVEKLVPGTAVIEENSVLLPILGAGELANIVRRIIAANTSEQIEYINSIALNKGLDAEAKERLFVEVVIGLINSSRFAPQYAGRFTSGFEGEFGNYNLEIVGLILARITKAIEYDETSSGYFLAGFVPGRGYQASDIVRLAVSLTKAQIYDERQTGLFVAGLAPGISVPIDKVVSLAVKIAIGRGFNEKQVYAFASCIATKRNFEVDPFCAEVFQLFRTLKSRENLEIIYPPMLEVQGQTYKRIMLGDLTDREAVQFLIPDEIIGDNASSLRAQLQEPVGVSLTFASLFDAQKYISEANRQGRKFRFMTNDEFEALPDDVKIQISSKNWFLVESSRGSGLFYFRSLAITGRDFGGDPNKRLKPYAIRLVED